MQSDNLCWKHIVCCLNPVPYRLPDMAMHATPRLCFSTPKQCQGCFEQAYKELSSILHYEKTTPLIKK